MQSQDNDSNEVKVVCFICGRKQLRSILAKHLKGCEGRYKREEEKKTKEPQKPCPLPPTELHEVLKNENCPAQKIEIYNQKALAKCKNQSQPICKKCFKQFNSQAFPAHEVGCQAKPQVPSEKSSSGPALRRATSYDSDFRKPKVLMCAICGREFGLTSLKIHHPQCVEKFNNEESKKPKHQRREVPLMDEHFLRMMNMKEDWDNDDIEEFNSEANRIYRDKGLVKCYNCGRAFFIQSIDKHRKNCKLIFGQINMYEEPAPPPKDDILVKPRVVMCHICGRQYGTKSLAIHQRQCTEKFLNEQRKKLKASDMKPIPELPQQIKSKFNLNTLSDWTSQQLQSYNSLVFDFYNKRTLEPCPNCNRTFLPESLLKHLKGCHAKSLPHRSYSAPPVAEQPPKQPRKPKTLVCYICGREFGLVSLNIHQPQCEIRYRNDQSKKDIDDRKDLPEIDQKYKTIIEEEKWTDERIEEFNTYMFDLYKSTVLEKCYTCGRTFFHESLLKHKKFCVKKESNSPSKGSPKPSASQKLLKKPSVKFIVEKVQQQQNEDEDQTNIPKMRKTTTQTEIEANRFLKPTIASSTKIERRTVPVAPATPKTPKIQTPRPKADEKQEPRKKIIRKEPLPKFTKPTASTKKIEDKGEEKKESRTSIQLEQKDREQIKEIKKVAFQQNNKNQQNLQKEQSIYSSGERQQLLKNIQKQVRLKIRTEPNELQQQTNNIELNLDEIKLQSPKKAQISETEVVKCQFCEKRVEQSNFQKHLQICFKKPRGSPRKATQSFVTESPQQGDIERCMKCHQKFPKQKIEKHLTNCKGTKQDEGARRKVSTPSVVMAGNVQPRGNKKEHGMFSLQANSLFPTEGDSEFQECTKCKRKFLTQRMQQHLSSCTAGKVSQIKNLKQITSPRKQTNKSFTSNSSSKGNGLNKSGVFESLPDKVNKHEHVEINENKLEPSIKQNNSIIKGSSQSKELLKNMVDTKNRKRPTEIHHHSELNKSSADLKRNSEENNRSFRGLRATQSAIVNKTNIQKKM